MIAFGGRTAPPYSGTCFVEHGLILTHRMWETTRLAVEICYVINFVSGGTLISIWKHQPVLWSRSTTEAGFLMNTNTDLVTYQYEVIFTSL